MGRLFTLFKKLWTYDDGRWDVPFSPGDAMNRNRYLARPRLRPARGIRQFDSAERGAAGFSGLAKGGTESLMRGKCLGAISILRLLFRGRVPAEVTPIKIQ